MKIVNNLKIFLTALIRYTWVMSLGAITLSLVVLSLSAYQFKEAVKSRASSGEHQFINYESHLDRIIARKGMAAQESARRLRHFDTLLGQVPPREELIKILRESLLKEQDSVKIYLPLPSFPSGNPSLSKSTAGGAAASATAASATKDSDILVSAKFEGTKAQLTSSDAQSTSQAEYKKEEIVNAYRSYLDSIRHRETLLQEYISLQNNPSNGQNSITPAHAAILDTAYRELLHFENLEFLTGYQFDPASMALMPAWMLSLIVTLSMGALGSLIYVVRSFLQDKLNESAGCTLEYRHRPLSWFILRPLMGVVTALAFFVVLQAGLTLSDGALSGSAPSLNPYFGAAVALICGLMSWQAIERIEQWGKRFFGNEAIQRWAYGLNDTIRISGKSKKDLAEYLKVADDQIDQWANEKLRVPQDVQDKIVSFFGSTDRRHLFSDQPTGALRLS